MCNLVPPLGLASAAVVFFGHYGDVSHFAAEQGISRQSIYRQAHAVERELDPAYHQQQVSHFHQWLADLQTRLDELQRQLVCAVVVDRDKQMEFAATGQALGVSLSAVRSLLRVLLGRATPSVAKLGRLTRAAGRQASATLAVLDEFSCGRASQIAADEIFSGCNPILMTIEQNSMCWLGGHLSASCDSVVWADELRRLPAAEQLTADGALGIRKGLELVNEQRQQKGLSVIAEQRDHFHALKRARKAVQHVRHQAVQALRAAERAQQVYAEIRHHGTKLSPMQGRQLNKKWANAEQAFDKWSAAEKVFARLCSALRLFAPDGELNTRARAEEEMRQALAEQTGADWIRARRLLGAKAFTFLDRVHQQLAALPVSKELREAALQVEGLRRRPEALRGEGSRARTLRGVLFTAELVLALAGEAGQQAATLVAAVLASTWRSSSLIEGLNSVLRMQQARQKRLTQGLLDLKRVHWNMHVFRAGKRKNTTPYGRLGLVLPPEEWWGLLKRPPEQLRQQLSQLNRAA